MIPSITIIVFSYNYLWYMYCFMNGELKWVKRVMRSLRIENKMGIFGSKIKRDAEICVISKKWCRQFASEAKSDADNSHQKQNINQILHQKQWVVQKFHFKCKKRCRNFASNSASIADNDAKKIHQKLMQQFT